MRSFSKIAAANAVSINAVAKWPEAAKRYIEDRTLSEESLQRAAVRYVGKDSAKKLLGFAVAGLLIPFPAFDDGSPTNSYVLKPIPATPRSAKFLAKKGKPTGVYFAPIEDSTWPKMAKDSEVTIYICEGPLKALRLAQQGFCVLAGNGISGLGGSRKGFKKDLDAIIWDGRRIVIVPDSDYATNPDVRAAVVRLAKELRNRGSLVFIKLLDPKHGKGVDDVLSAKDGEKHFKKAPEVDSKDSMFDTWHVHPTVAEMNKRYAVVQLGDKMRVMQEPEADSDDDASKMNVYLDRNTFANLFENQYVDVNTPLGPRRIPAGDFWLASPERRQYRGMRFAPGQELPADQYNLWRGWGVEPAKGSWSLFKAHLLEVVAAGNRDHYRWIVNWLANRVQKFGLIEQVLIICSEGEGAGKTLTAEIIGRMFGDHFITVTSAEDVFGRFNARFEFALFVLAEEAFFAGDPRESARLRALVTQRNIAIERKGIEAYGSLNRRAWLWATNSEQVVRAERSSRRWAIFDVDESKIGDLTYFHALKKQMYDDGGCGAMLYDLLKMPIEPIEEPPRTLALARNKVMSLKPAEEYVFKLLGDGKINGKDWSTDKPMKINREALVMNFAKHLRHGEIKLQERHSLATQIGSALVRMIGRKNIKVKQKGKGVRVTVLPNLATSRLAFESRYDLAIDWATAEVLRISDDL